MNTNKISFLIFNIALIIISIPQITSAASLSFNLANNNIDNKVTVIEVKIDPQSKNLNVVEGIIKIDGLKPDQLFVDTDVKGSVLKLWTLMPQYYPNEKVIRFTGGSTEGFNKESLLLRLRIASSVSSKASISLIGGSAYLNDGKGTTENIASRSLNINLDKQDIASIEKILADKNPPTFDFVKVVKDKNSYDGKYFINFYAVDDKSNISRYEVQEGNTITEVADGNYVFKDQERKNPITITAYDQAGNSNTVTVPAKSSWLKYVIIILVVIIVLILFIFKYARKK